MFGLFLKAIVMQSLRVKTEPSVTFISSSANAEEKVVSDIIVIIIAFVINRFTLSPHII
jgi:hypothetical protein